MNNKLVTDVALSVMLIMIIATQITPKKRPIKIAQALNTENTRGLRGFACALVIIHHASIDYGLNTYAFAGPACVALFFFLSGYGVTMAYMADPKQYASRYPRNRLLYAIGTYVLMDTAFWITAHTITPGQPALFGLWRMLTSGKITHAAQLMSQIKPHDWFMVPIIVMYAAVYIGMLIAKGDVRILCAAAFTAATGLVVMWCLHGHPIMMATGPNTIYMFPAGMCFAIYRDQILNFANRHLRKITIITILIAVLPTPRFGYTIAATILALICSAYVSFRGKILQAVGKISFEAYLAQTVFTRGFPIAGSPVANLPLPGVWCVLCSIAAGAAWHIVLKPFRIKICNRKS